MFPQDVACDPAGASLSRHCPKRSAKQTGSGGPIQGNRRELRFVQPIDDETNLDSEAVVGIRSGRAPRQLRWIEHWRPHWADRIRRPGPTEVPVVTKPGRRSARRYSCSPTAFTSRTALWVHVGTRRLHDRPAGNRQHNVGKHRQGRGRSYHTHGPHLGLSRNRSRLTAVKSGTCGSRRSQGESSGVAGGPALGDPA